jgi:plastocyanin
MVRAGFIAVLVAIAACGSAMAPSSAGSSGGPGSGTGGSGLCHDGVASGCTLFTDLTAATAVIDFGDSFGNAYVPKCARVRVGQSITFNGPFALHPLSQTCGPAGAIPHTTSGTTVTFQINTAETYGYQCDVHFGAGMNGAFQVVP